MDVKLNNLKRIENSIAGLSNIVQKMLNNRPCQDSRMINTRLLDTETLVTDLPDILEPIIEALEAVQKRGYLYKDPNEYIRY